MNDPVFTTRVADLLHLLEHAEINCPSPGDAEQAQRIMQRLRDDLKRTNTFGGSGQTALPTAPRVN